MKIPKLVELNKTLARKDQIFETDVIQIGTEKVGEEALIRAQLDRMRTLILGERVVELPGMTRNLDLIVAAIADFKEVKKKSVRPLYLATNDDITIEPLRPQVFGLTTYTRTGLAPGVINIVPTGAGNYSVDTDNEIIFVTDVIEFDPSAGVTAIKFTIDGEPIKPESIRVQIKDTDLQIYDLASPEMARNTFDLDTRLESGTSTELTPIGAHIAMGHKIPSL